jgi:N4-gp56 family major capsid protein
MSGNLYSTQAGRINEVKGEMIAHAIPHEVLANGFTMKSMKDRSGDNITYRRVLPTGAATTNANTINRWSVTAAAYQVSEGVTPAAQQIVYYDVTATLNQYGILFSYSDKAAKLYEDDIPGDQKMMVGETMGLVREMIRYGGLKACTNAFYSGGTSRATVDEKVTLNFLRHITKVLKLNGAKMKNRVLAATPDYDTSAIEGGYNVFCSTDLEPDIRDLPGFVPVAKYANRKPINEFEIGSCENFRFLTSKELTAYADAGAAIAGTTNFSTTGTSADVYPILVMGEDAAFDIALRGEDSLDVIHLPHNKPDKADALGQRGYVGAKFWSAVLVANPGWMAVGEVATTNTTPA